MGIVMSLCLTSAFYENASTQDAAEKSFTVGDEIGLALFNDPDGLPPEAHFSPDGSYFAVWSERGNLISNRVEDSLSFYNTGDVERFVKHPADSKSPSPTWVVNRSDSRGRIINDWRWLSDSTAVAFLEGSGPDNQRLVLADVQKKTLEPLTGLTEKVYRFDIRDRQHFVYVAADLAEIKRKRQAESQASVVIGTGRSFNELTFPEDERVALSSRKLLWAVMNGRRWELKRDGEPLDPGGDFALSPDARSLVTRLPVSEVPLSWETLYPPPYASSPDNHIHAGRQDVKEYVRLNLQTGSATPLTDAPVSDAGGWWWGGAGAAWSSDGEEVLLLGTFIKSKENAPSRPCVAVVDLSSNTASCVEVLKVRSEEVLNGHKEIHREEGFHDILGAEFAAGDKERVVVRHYNPSDESVEETEYRRHPGGSWQGVGHFKAGRDHFGGLEIAVRQGLNDPPVLVATWKHVSRIIWDPNPQLKNFDLGQAAVYTWKDAEGRNWRGGLYKPAGYVPKQRYPLVIQNHGFSESNFLPSGVFPSGFAARSLAAHGIIVLQVAGSLDCSSADETPDEAACEISGYVSAAKQLISEGLVDPERIGVIGFSRTCYYVMEALTTNPLHFRAASITDGGILTYSQYIMGFARSEFETMIGAKPFGEGLQQWLKRSPGFNLDKVNAPLLIVAEGRLDVPFMWEPYAGLYYLHKPVELMILNTSEHILTNPAARMASQGGSVDWFRFWLQDYEDPAPAKAEQYKRWRELRKLQEQNARQPQQRNPPPIH